jgi:putative hydrolase of the HAD superfamily
MKNLIFDLGLVLVGWDPRAVLEKHFSDSDDCENAAVNIFEHQDWQELDRGSFSESEAIQRFARNTGFSEEVAAGAVAAVRNSIVALEPGVALLEWVRERGTPLYCISNMATATYEQLRPRHEFFDHFEDIVVSGYVKLIKPEAEIFTYALERFSLPANECLFLDDRPENVAAARELGIHAVQYESTWDCVDEVKSLLLAND